MLKMLDLFSGIGGFSYAGEKLVGGYETVAFCEYDKHCQKVLRKHWPDTEIIDDVKELAANCFRFRENIDVITGGFPCQDISYANKNAEGIYGKRSGLWRVYANIIEIVRPSWVVIENSPALLNRGFASVLQDISQIGYDAEWHCISASSIGTPHKRERLFVVAYPNDRRTPLRWHRVFQENEKSGENGCNFRNRDEKPYIWRWRQEQSRPYGMADGVSDRIYRLRELGNSIVPPLAARILWAIKEAHYG